MLTRFLLVIAMTLAAGGAQAQLPDAIPQTPELSPARLLSGAAPSVPPMLLQDSETIIEATIGLDGRVAAVRPLRPAGLTTDLLAAAVRGWRFEPASRRHDIDTSTIRFSITTTRVSTALILAMFRSPSLAAPALRDVPDDIAAAVDESPRPVAWIAPVFPQRAFASGVVLLELNVACDGAVSNARVVESSPPYDEAALDAVRRWRFRPGVIDGRPVPALVYVVLGFSLTTEPDAEQRR